MGRKTGLEGIGAHLGSGSVAGLAMGPLEDGKQGGGVTLGKDAKFRMGDKKSEGAAPGI